MAAIRLVMSSSSFYGAVAGYCQAGRAEWEKIEAAGLEINWVQRNRTRLERVLHIMDVPVGVQSKYDKATSHALDAQPQTVNTQEYRFRLPELVRIQSW